ncbi:MAG: GDP-mannose 4,6-dehydratase [candidate division WOR-3 bacterium]|nr:GDP-mannose 4,6-dehydratase [candidate division WOR-3 bacterium]MCX7837129.1 GDP-mannose 4,6-dehydratase [candidate division WOR-3 bacterium]MDW8113662.1 GDP-mannose 4,6-dehydratase [candidate division WOR-3 bacterium]
MKILITGSEGFAGGYLFNFLINKGYEVFGTYYALPNEIKDNQFFLDIRKKEEIIKLLEKLKPEGIFHLAAQTSVALSYKEEYLTYEVNTLGTLNLLWAIKELNLKVRFIYISTAEVYGEIAERRKAKEDDELNPISPYALSKYFAEKIVQYYVTVYDIDALILRPFSHTGIGQKESFFFPYCCKKIAEIEKNKIPPILEVGNLEVERDYLAVEDIVEAYYLAFIYGKKGEIYNITNGKPIKLREALEFLLSQTDKEIRIVFSQERERKKDIFFLSGDNTKFKNLTNFEPRLEIRDTLTKMLNYYRKIV